MYRGQNAGFFIESIEEWKLLVGGNGVLHLLNLAQRGHDGLAVHDVAHLVFVEGIALYGKRTVNGLDFIRLAQE